MQASTGSELVKNLVVGYAYDANGNQTSTTDARGIVSNICRIGCMRDNLGISRGTSLYQPQFSFLRKDIHLTHDFG